MANQVVWFDMPVNDLDRAIRFYSAVLGVALKKEQFSGMSGATLPHEGKDVSGSLVECVGARADGNAPSRNGPLLYFSCQGRLDQAIAAVVPAGGTVLHAKHSIGPYGFRAILLDSEGNRIALHST
jgi:predicted enzyme related to lactoylglutathione lyase